MTSLALKIAAIVGALAGLAGIIVATIMNPQAAAVGWLFTLIMAWSLTTGAICALLTGKLTGGLWAESLANTLLPLARLVPLVGIAFIPLFFFLAQIYPWAARGAENPLVGAIYLNEPFVIGRVAIAFIGWSLIAYFVIPLPGRAGQIAAGLSLIFHIFGTTLLGYDWILALQPSMTSSAFGAHVAILFMMSAMAFAALFSRLEPEKASKDVAGLLIALILGTIYMDYMQYLIIWYGDLKDTNQFYLDRAGLAQEATIGTAFAVGGVLPLAMMLSEKSRKSPEMVKAASLFILVGVVLHWCWVIFGLFPAIALPIALPAILLIAACLVLGAATRLARVPAQRGYRI
ncbi:MAG TPA: hypothetical protein VFJ18_00630 [Pararhizobium sp.]|nr:hypothetical protein [Pararhizobium sp.]